MSVLVDTNLLIRIAEPDHPNNSIAAAAVNWFLARGEIAHLLPQNAYEFWVVATRPVANNGLGMNTGTAAAKLEGLLRTLILLPDLPEIFPRWQRLVRDNDCKGKMAHDVRLVAGMMVHRVPRILTFNKQDFVRFSQIQVVAPDDVLLQKP